MTSENSVNATMKDIQFGVLAGVRQYEAMDEPSSADFDRLVVEEVAKSNWTAPRLVNLELERLRNAGLIDGDYLTFAGSELLASQAEEYNFDERNISTVNADFDG